MSETVEAAKAEFGRAKGRILWALANTPDDRINWSPSPTARTPIHIVAHAAESIGGITKMIKGDPLPFIAVSEIDAMSLAMEKDFTTREAVIELMERHASDFEKWLDSLTDEQVASSVDLPFGAFPMAAAITFPADHLRGHSSQIEYIQTIYGDRDWHMPS